MKSPVRTADVPARIRIEHPHSTALPEPLNKLYSYKYMDHSYKLKGRRFESPMRWIFFFNLPNPWGRLSL
jgi:hypothetical protein